MTLNEKIQYLRNKNCSIQITSLISDNQLIFDSRWIIPVKQLIPIPRYFNTDIELGIDQIINFIDSYPNN